MFSIRQLIEGGSMLVHISPLVKQPLLIDTVVQYMQMQWGLYHQDREPPYDWRQNLYLNTNSLPITVVAVDENAGSNSLAGFVSLNLRATEKQPRSVWLEHMYVPEKYRGRGIAKQLIQALITLAESIPVDGQCINAIELRTFSAKGLYLKHGWEAIGTEIYYERQVTRMRRYMSTSCALV